MNKILYKQKGFNEEFGEFEVDYVYLSKVENKINFNAVPEEIADVKWLSRNELPLFIEEVVGKGGYITPWFRHMY